MSRPVRPQIPNNSEPATDENDLFNTAWYTWLQGVYKFCRFDLPTKLSGILNVSTTPASNDDINATNLSSYTLPAKMMKNNGDYLEIETWGTFAANGNGKNVTLEFGSQVILTTGATSPNDGSWRIGASILRLSATTQEIDAFIISGNTTISTFSIRTAGTQDLTQSVIIKCTGTGGASGDISQKAMIIKLSPND